MLSYGLLLGFGMSNGTGVEKRNKWSKNRTYEYSMWSSVPARPLSLLQKAAALSDVRTLVPSYVYGLAADCIGPEAVVTAPVKQSSSGNILLFFDEYQ